MEFDQNPISSTEGISDVELSQQLAGQVVALSSNQMVTQPVQAIPPQNPNQDDLSNYIRAALEVKAVIEASESGSGIPGTPHQLPSESSGDGLYDPIQSQLGGFFIGQTSGLRKGEFLLEGIIPASGLGFCYGPPGCNKTTLLMDLAVHMASGQVSWNGKQLMPGPVIFYGMEDVHGAFRQAHGLADLHCFDLPKHEIYVPEEPLDLKVDSEVSKLIGAIMRVAQLNEKWPRLVVIDTLSDALGASDDSDQSEVKQLLNRAERVSKELGIFICFIHHETKNTGSLRGSGALKAKAYMVLKIDKTGTLNKRKVTVEKLRGGADGQSFNLELKPHIWTDHDHGELSCAALYVTFNADSPLSRLSPKERYNRSLSSLGPHQKAIAISLYDFMETKMGEPERQEELLSPLGAENERFRAADLHSAFEAYSRYCDANGTPCVGTTEAEKRSQFVKKVKQLEKKPAEYVAYEGQGQDMILWIPRIEFKSQDLAVNPGS